MKDNYTPKNDNERLFYSQPRWRRGKAVALVIVALMALILGLTGCKSDDKIDELPTAASSFINQYWPLRNVSKCVHTSDDTWVATIEAGPVITFDSAGSWTDIDGQGGKLPQVLIYDQLPDKLYEYLEATEQTDQVYAASRTPRVYTLQLFDTTLYYTIATATISGNP